MLWERRVPWAIVRTERALLVSPGTVASWKHDSPREPACF